LGTVWPRWETLTTRAIAEQYEKRIFMLILGLFVLFKIADEIRFSVNTRMSLSVRGGLAEWTRLDR
jgi:hypothetical protein